VAQKKDKWKALVNTEMNLWVPLNIVKFLSSFAMAKGLSFMNLLNY
jgi:hypothetical protein